MNLQYPQTRPPEEMISINGLSLNDPVILVDPDRGLTFHGVLKKKEGGDLYVLCEKALSTSESYAVGVALPLTADWQIDPSIFYSEENVRQIIDLWGYSTIEQAVKALIPEFKDLLEPGDEFYSKGVAKKLKDDLGLDSAQNRIIFNILYKADLIIAKDAQGEIHVCASPPGEAQRYTLHPSVLSDDEWIIRDGAGILVGPEESFEDARKALDILNEKGPVGLSHPLPQGFATIEIPTGPWCVVHQQGWVTEPGWQGETEVEAIENFQDLNPGFFHDMAADTELESDIGLTP